MKQPWVIEENKAGNGVDTPRFFIDYSRNKEKTREISCQILSLLKRDADMIVKIDSSLLNLPSKQRDGIIFGLIDELKLLGLEYRYRKFLGTASPNLLNQLFPFRKNEEYHHEVVIDLPDSVWRQEYSSSGALRSALGHGTFYYVCKSSVKGREILDDYFNGRITPADLRDYFTLSVYDWPGFGRMGLFVESFELQELKQLLMNP